MRIAFPKSAPTWISSIAYVFVYPGVFLRHRLVPYDISGGEAHDKVHMVGAFCDGVNIVAESMRFGEKDLGHVLFLYNVVNPIIFIVLG